MSVGGGPATPLQRRSMIDPSNNELFQRYAGEKKPWVDAAHSSHVWVADLPDDLTPGTYTLSVRATNEFGRDYHAHKVLLAEQCRKAGVAVWACCPIPSHMHLVLVPEAGIALRSAPMPRKN